MVGICRRRTQAWSAPRPRLRVDLLPLGANMGPRQTAVNTLSYATRSRGEKAGQESTKVIGTDVCECPRCTESGPGQRVDQRSPTPVGGGWTTATTAFVRVKPTRSKFP